MSIYVDKPKSAHEINSPCKGVERILEARLSDLGSFTVKRLLPSHHQSMVGPWIFFDHFGPVDIAAGKTMDVRPHPHINMATVTHIFEGELMHRDSTGSVQLIKPGQVNVMFAGRGIVHSERTPEHLVPVAYRLHGLQLWLAMSEVIEQDEPCFYHFSEEDIPAFKIGDVEGRVMMGSAYGVTSGVKTFSPTLFFEATLPQGAELTLPGDVTEIGVYIVEGRLVSGEILLEEGMMAVSTHHDGIHVKATEPTRIVVIGGEPLGHRYIWWNFVSSRMERIKQAAYDWDERKFPEIPTDHVERIPLPEKKPE